MREDTAGVKAPKQQVAILKNEIELLREKNRELEETLDAIRSGEVDAIVVSKGEARRIYTLEGVDHPYRALVENIREGALTLSRTGMILYTNTRFADMAKLPPDKIPGTSLIDYVCPEYRTEIEQGLREITWRASRFRVRIRQASSSLPVLISMNPLTSGEEPKISVVVTDRQRDEEELRMQVRMLDSVGDAVIATDTGGKIIYWNAAATRTYGWKPEEVVGHDFSDIRTWGIPGKKTEEIMELLANGIPWSGEYVGHHQDGRDFPVSVHEAPVFDDNGTLIAVICTSHNITERKYAERALRESESILRSFFDSAGVMRGIVEVIAEDDVLHITDNAMTASFIGMTPGAMKNKRGSELGEPRDILRMWVSHYNESRKSKKPVTFEYTDKRGKSETWLLATVSYLGTPPGGYPRFAYVVFDITERKRAEEALREAQERTSTILEGIADTFYSLDEEWRFTLVNPAAEKAPFDRPAAELIGRVIWDLYPNLVGTRIHQHYLDAARKNTLEHYEAQSPLNNQWYEVFMQGRKGRVDVYMRDITGRKKIEEALRQKNEELVVINEELVQANEDILANETRLRETHHHLETLVSGMRIGILLVLGDKLGLVNQTFCDYFGLKEKPEELIGLESPELIDKIKGTYCDPDKEVNRIEEIKRRGEPVIGEEIAIQGNRMFLRDYIPVSFEGTLSGRLWYHVDITDRKRAEEAIREREERLRQANELLEAVTAGTNVIIAAVDNNFNYTFFNNAYKEEIQRLTRKNITIGTNILALFGDMPEQQRIVLEEWTRTLRGERSSKELVFGEPGQYRKIYNRLHTPIHDSHGGVIGAGEVAIDITSQVQAEEALREGEERMRFALETSRTGAWDLDLSDHTTHRSLDHDMIFGYTELLPSWTYEMFLDHVIPEDRASVDAKFRHATETGGDWNFECRIRRKDGEIRWIWAAGRHRPGGSGTLGRMSGIVQDITERKQAEEALRESEDRFRVIAETSPVLLSVSSIADGTILFTNRAYDSAFGFQPGEIIGTPAVDRFYDAAERSVSIDTLRRAGDIRNREVKVVRKDGTPFWVSASLARIRFGGNEAILGASVDITDRKLAETALRESEVRYRTVADFTYDWEFWIDPDGRFVYLSPSAERILGRPVSQYTSAENLFRDVTHPDDLKALLAHTAQEMTGQDSSSFEFRIVRLDGGVRWVNHVCRPVLDSEGRFLGIRGSNRDITDRKQAEEALLKARYELEIRVEERTAELKEAVKALDTEHRRLYDVLETLPVYVCLFDSDYRMPFANKYFRETFMEPEGRRCYDFLFNRTEPCKTCETYTAMRTRAPHQWFWTGPNGRDYDVYDFPFTDTDGSFMILEMGIDITEQKKAEDALLKANAYNRSLIEASLDPLVTINPDGKISDVNEATIRITGFSRGDLIGTDFTNYFTEPERAKTGYEKVFRDGSVTDYALEIRHRNGHVTPVLYNATVYRDAAGNVIGVFAAARDITERKNAEEALYKTHDLLEKRVKERTAELVQSKAQLKEEISQRMMAESLVKKTVSELYAAIESTADGIYAVDRAGRIIRFNQNFAAMWKIPDELLQSGEDHRVSEYLKAQVKNPGLFKDSDEEYVLHRNRETYDMLELKDGRIFERYSKPQKLDTQIIGRVMSYRDVTDRRHAEEKLIASLQEKETLIREIHHRVKNNLQIISGLLYMTRKRTPDSATNSILTDMMMKIKTMAQIHTRLYESKQFDRINMGSQIRDQMVDLSSIYGRSGAQIQSEIDAEEIYLSVDQAIPCALVVNEILSNAFKHAFRERTHGNMWISATRADDHIRIIVRDDGVGIPSDVDVERSTSLGLKLIRSLVQQLNGSVTITSDHGTNVMVEFPLNAGGK